MSVGQVPVCSVADACQGMEVPHVADLSVHFDKASVEEKRNSVLRLFVFLQSGVGS